MLVSDLIKKSIEDGKQKAWLDEINNNLVWYKGTVQDKRLLKHLGMDDSEIEELTKI